MDVSIIIVNYNTCKMLEDCINSIYKFTSDLEYEIIVSDNNSSDGSIEMLRKNFPKVVIVENKRNLGFGAANNEGRKISKGKYVFYLNSDTLLLNNAVKIFFDYFEKNGEKENLGALGCFLKDETGKRIHSFGNFATFNSLMKELIVMGITNFILSLLYILHIPAKKLRKYKKFSDQIVSYDEVKSVDYITGADLFMLNDQNASFDENYFLYYEDTKLQYDLNKIGKIRRIIEGPEIIHLMGGSVDENFSIKRKASFSRIQFEISRIKWCKDTGIKGFKLFVIRLLITLHWLNPLLISKTHKYISIIWK